MAEDEGEVTLGRGRRLKVFADGNEFGGTDRRNKSTDVVVRHLHVHLNEHANDIGNVEEDEDD